MARSRANQADASERVEASAEAPTADIAPAPKLLKFSVSLPHCKPGVVECASRDEALPAYLALIGATATSHLPVIQEVTEAANA